MNHFPYTNMKKVLFIIFYPKEYNKKIKTTIKTRNPTTCPGLSINLLLYSSSNRMSPPNTPELGMPNDCCAMKSNQQKSYKNLPFGITQDIIDSPLLLCPANIAKEKLGINL